MLFITFNLIFKGRFLSGVVISGVDTIGLLYINEIAYNDKRDKYGTIFQNTWGVGSVLTFVIGLGLPSEPSTPSKYWMFLLGLPGLCCLIHLIAFLFVFKDDTPSFYYLKTL